MFDDLNEKQREAVFADDGPLLIVAGAGSGKTKTLTSRILYFIAEKKVEPARILAITFTNKAADEMKARVLNALAKNSVKTFSEPHLSTFHSFGAFALRELYDYADRTKSFSIFDDDDSFKLLKGITKDMMLDKTKSAPYFAREISKIKSELVDEDSFTGEEVVWEVYQLYEKALQKNNAFDFDDLIEKPVRIFRSYPETARTYQDRYTHVLVDEYQDVNTSQYWLLKLLAGTRQNVTVVGDDAQSIYRFRFSDFRNFLNFERNWPNARVVYLEQNYRSSKNIIEASSNLIAKNLHQKKKNLWTENSEGTPVQIVEHDDEFSEADFIVGKARTLHEKKKHVGILYRTNAQSRALEQMLIEYGLEYRLFGAVSFYERKEIRDVISALRYAFNPADEVSLERLRKNLYKKDFLLVRDLLPQKAPEVSPAQLIREFVSAVSYPTYLQSEFTNFAERMENVEELEYFAEQFDSLGVLLEKIALVDGFDSGRRKKRGSRHDAGNSIDLMTVHLAKGLEFDAVLVAGVNEGTLPHHRSYYDPDELEEERRLMYVAMTRAKEELYLNFYNMPSRFLFELPGDKVVFHGEKKLDDEERYIEYD
jgi:DNA helicase-2/ATP-dependent DNA helicase PcrA